jgi:hypothetical protein
LLSARDDLRSQPGLCSPVSDIDEPGSDSGRTTRRV